MKKGFPFLILFWLTLTCTAETLPTLNIDFGDITLPIACDVNPDALNCTPPVTDIHYQDFNGSAIDARNDHFTFNVLSAGRYRIGLGCTDLWHGPMPILLEKPYPWRMEKQNTGEVIAQGTQDDWALLSIPTGNITREGYYNSDDTYYVETHLEPGQYAFTTSESVRNTSHAILSCKAALSPVYHSLSVRSRPSVVSPGKTYRVSVDYFGAPENSRLRAQLLNQAEEVVSTTTIVTGSGTRDLLFTIPADYFSHTVYTDAQSLEVHLLDAVKDETLVRRWTLIRAQETGGNDHGTLTLPNPPDKVQPGEEVTLSVQYNTNLNAARLVATLIDTDGNPVLRQEAETGNTSPAQITFTLPPNTPAGDGYHWRVRLFSPPSKDELLAEKSAPTRVAPAGSLTLGTLPSTVNAGDTVEIPADYTTNVNAVIEASLLDANGSEIVTQSTPVDSGSNTAHLSLTLPADTPAGGDYRWRVRLTEAGGSAMLAENSQGGVTVQNSSGGNTSPPSDSGDQNSGGGSGATSPWMLAIILLYLCAARIRRFGEL